MADVHMETATVATNNNNIIDNNVQMEEESSDSDIQKVDNKCGMKISLTQEQEVKYGGIRNLLINSNCNPEVADAILELFINEIVTENDYDERVIDKLATMHPKAALFLIAETKRSRFFGVHSRPSYFMATVKHMNDRIKQQGLEFSFSQQIMPGPKYESIKELIDETGYQLEVTVGQRKYHSPPGWEGPAPSAVSNEVFIGQIPKNIYEDALVRLFAQYGQIWDLRILMDPINGGTRGYAFLAYTDVEASHRAVENLNGYEIQPGCNLKVNVSVANRRLYIGNLPKSKTQKDILEEFKKFAEGVENVIMYTNPDDPKEKKSRGFCFIDFNEHKNASDCKRKMQMGRIKIFNTDLICEWAEQQSEVSEEVMKTVKMLYVRNLKEGASEQRVKEAFSAYGPVVSVKRIRDFAFVDFEERDHCLKAMEEMNNKEFEGGVLEISLAKPQLDPNRKKTNKPSFGKNDKRKRGSYDMPEYEMYGHYQPHMPYIPAPPRMPAYAARPPFRGYPPVPPIHGYRPYPGYPPYDPYYDYQEAYDYYTPTHPGYEPYPEYGAMMQPYIAAPPRKGNKKQRNNLAGTKRRADTIPEPATKRPGGHFDLGTESSAIYGAPPPYRVTKNPYTAVQQPPKNDVDFSSDYY
uniref:Heterogeneous nuclear ribonucleoprotein Q n=1 Tax=Parastrongyloides trichosuri TaxID=131310 RepID=A0A0N5A2E8_PARTI